MTTSDEENQSIGSILQDTTENPDPPEPKQETGVPTPDSVESTPKRNKTLLTDLGFRKSPRGVIELSRAGVEYSHERRALMKERELQQLHKIVTSPLTGLGFRIQNDQLPEASTLLFFGRSLPDSHET
jgi:hypothetical protein